MVWDSTCLESISGLVTIRVIKSPKLLGTSWDAGWVRLFESLGEKGSMLGNCLISESRVYFDAVELVGVGMKVSFF